MQSSFEGFSNPGTINRIPKDWKWIKIKDLCNQVTSGGTPLRSEKKYYTNGEINWFKTQELSNWYLFDSTEKITKLGLENSSAKLFPKNTILMAMYGDGKTITSLGILSKPSASNQACCAMIPNKETCLPLFLFYSLVNYKEDFLFIARGGAQRNLNVSLIKNFGLLVPPLDTQHKIVDILGSLDDKIELNRQMNETLEAMARTIFKSWFVDFDPVIAKMEGRDYPLPAEVMDLFPDELEESELGLIPKGWQIGTIEKNIEIQNGFAFKSEDYVENGVFVFRTKNFSSNNYVERLHDDVFLQNSFLESNKKFICQPYDFHVVMVGASIGKTSIIYPNCLPALRNQNMWCFRPKNGFSYKHFVNLSMNNLIHTKLSWASGSARDFFRKSDFYNFKIIYPQIDLLNEFEKLIGCIFQKIGSNLSQIDILVELREVLLPKLIKGEIEIWEEQ